MSASTPIMLQKSAAPRPIAKTGNIRIRRVEFLNQNSLFGLDLEKVFFARGLKIVLQHYHSDSDRQPSKRDPALRASRRHSFGYSIGRSSKMSPLAWLAPMLANRRDFMAYGSNR